MGSGDAARRGRVLGVDLGSVRIGLALSDSARVLASPYGILARSKDKMSDYRAIAAIVEENEVCEVVVGLPLLLSGRRGEAARIAEEEMRALRELVSVPVLGRDERLSTVEATRLFKERIDRRWTSSPRPRKTTRAPIDDAAAAVVLQGFLDEYRVRPS